jgi:hypothetical protein
MILDRVVRPARQQLRDLGPTVAELLVRLEDDHVLLFGPRVLPDLWVEVVEPPAHANADSSADVV